MLYTEEVTMLSSVNWRWIAGVAQDSTGTDRASNQTSIEIYY